MGSAPSMGDGHRPRRGARAHGSSDGGLNGSGRPGRSGSAGHVELAFPNTDRFSMLARMTGAVLAASVGFDVAELERLRLALDGVWSMLHVSVPIGETLHLGFETSPYELRLQGGAGGPRSTVLDPVRIDVTWLSAADHTR